MKKSKYLNLLNVSALTLATLAMPVATFAEENQTEDKTNAGLRLGQGDFILMVSDISSFGTYEIQSYKQIAKTGFDAPFTVIDARGTQQGWDLTVSSTGFSIMEPEDGWVVENPYSLPLGSLSLNTLEKIEGVYKEKKEIHPTADELGVVIDLGQEVRVAHAEKGKGMGQYALTHADDALELVIDPATAKVDKVNYPDSVTPYEALITWNLISGPGTLDNGNNGDIVAEDEPEDLKGDTEPEVKTFEFEKQTSEDNVFVLRIEDASKIKEITASNGGTVEIISINGSEVTVRVIGGTPSEKILISGEYIPAQEKFVTAQDKANYSDAEGYSGTLTKYLHSGTASDTQYFEGQASGGINYKVDTFVGYTMPYASGNYSGTLYYISEEVIEHSQGVNLDVDFTAYSNDNTSSNLNTLSEQEIKDKLYADHPYLKNITVKSMEWTGEIESGSYTSDGTSYPYKREAAIKITVDGFETIVTLGGNISSPDTRVYKYQGTVVKPESDTRVYEYLYDYKLSVTFK